MNSMILSLVSKLSTANVFSQGEVRSMNTPPTASFYQRECATVLAEPLHHPREQLGDVDDHDTSEHTFDHT